MTTTPFHATVLGVPRIGPNRELKRATERYWAKKISQTELLHIAADLRSQSLTSLVEAGLDSIPVNTFSFYDQMLDTAVLLGALPERVKGIHNDLDRYFAAARGTAEIAPLEMTKWFDTNYHYIVPEIGPSTQFCLNPTKILAELAEAHQHGIDQARPVIIGPLTFLLLSKAVDGAPDPIFRLDEVIDLYIQLLAQLAQAGAQWVQIDEPILVTDASDDLAGWAMQAYSRLSEPTQRPAIFVATYFGTLKDTLPALASTGIEAIGVDLIYGDATEITQVPELADKTLVAGIVDGRNIWRTDLERALSQLDHLRTYVEHCAVSTSCSLLHVPYSLTPESDLDPTLARWLAFGQEKIAEVATLSRGLRHGHDSIATAIQDSSQALASRQSDARVCNESLRNQIAQLHDQGIHRGTPQARREAQQAHLHLPLLPTTTIGSFPQTVEIRKSRAELVAGHISSEEYTQRMKEEIAAVIQLQERLDLDVLVHGEPERNDMVQYFAEQLEGFFATRNGWVQSYGTRCVRPPILFGDVYRSHPMTVEWATYAQSLTSKPVKGMLTGPVTIIAWSFVRDDQPLSQTADQIAVAIRQETVDLEQAGISVIQIDEPALRELLPLRHEHKQAYLDWAVNSFKLATSGVKDSTQIHTHLCYSEFGEIIQAIADLDADVTSIEAARSHMEVLDDLNAIGFSNSVGPGIYDIHSPRIPSVAEMVHALHEALKSVPAQRLWANPDCGLKTRSLPEVTESLQNLVTATKQVRAEIS